MTASPGASERAYLPTPIPTPPRPRSVLPVSVHLPSCRLTRPALRPRRRWACLSPSTWLAPRQAPPGTLVATSGLSLKPGTTSHASSIRGQLWAAQPCALHPRLTSPQAPQGTDQRLWCPHHRPQGSLALLSGVAGPAVVRSWAQPHFCPLRGPLRDPGPGREGSIHRRTPAAPSPPGWVEPCYADVGRAHTLIGDTQCKKEHVIELTT